MRSASILGLAGCVAVFSLAGAADWPQFRGPDRTNVSKETGLLKSWPKEGPELVWTFRKAGLGYSGPAIVGGKIYCMGAREGTEQVFALDGKGEELWSTKIGPVFDFKSNAWSRGPNATPTVDGDALYALGSQGDLVCVSVADGKERWRKNLPKDLGAEVNPIGGAPEKMGWGFSWSPLVDGDNVICQPGGEQGLLAALNKKTGEVVWRTRDVAEQATYSSPLVATLGGVRQYIQQSQNGVLGVAAKDGSLLWYYKRDNPYPDVVIPTPIVQGDQVYVTAWGGGAEVIKVTGTGNKFKAESVWAENRIGNRQGGVVLVGGSVFGYHEEREWACQDFATGEIKWTNNRLGAGSVLAADGRLYCLTEKGIVTLVEASAEKYKEVGRFTLPEASKNRKVRGGVWTHPVLADGKLYLRDQELMFCYKVK
jgi:outer membrane protein assembly factor BamB